MFMAAMSGGGFRTGVGRHFEVLQRVMERVDGEVMQCWTARGGTVICTLQSQVQTQGILTPCEVTNSTFDIL